MTHNSWTKHSGQVPHIHPRFCAVGNPAGFFKISFLSSDTLNSVTTAHVCNGGERDCLLLEVKDQVSQRVSVGLWQVCDYLVHLSFAVVIISNL